MALAGQRRRAARGPAPAALEQPVDPVELGAQPAGQRDRLRRAPAPAWPPPRPARPAWWPAGCAARARRWRRTGAAPRTRPPAVPAARRWCRRGPSARRPGPGTASRSCRLSAEIRRVAAVISRSGRSTRPATTQPSSTDTSVMMPSAITRPEQELIRHGLVPGPGRRRDPAALGCGFALSPAAARPAWSTRRGADRRRPETAGDGQQQGAPENSEQDAVQGGQPQPHGARRSGRPPSIGIAPSMPGPT